MHLKCPDCGHDFSVNSSKIIQDKDAVAKEIGYLNKKISELRAKNVSRNSPEYKRLVERLNDAHMRATSIKTAYKNIADNSEIEKYRIFMGYIKREIGQERAIELLKQAEDDLLYYGSYDMAKQNFTNFNNV